jgi:hypothetical protein
VSPRGKKGCLEVIHHIKKKRVGMDTILKMDLNRTLKVIGFKSKELEGCT